MMRAAVILSAVLVVLVMVIAGGCNGQEKRGGVDSQDRKARDILEGVPVYKTYVF